MNNIVIFGAPGSGKGTQSDKIENIVIHYTANPGTTAEQNRNYFEGLQEFGSLFI